jgi:outer membrane protein assembly factor BamB
MKTLLLAIAIISAANFVHAEQPPYSWRGINGSGVFPAQGLVTEFWDVPAADDSVVTAALTKAGLNLKPGDRKNIVWRTLLPHWGHNAPVCVNDRVFVLCAEGWKSDAPLLVCLDVNTGKILWQQAVDHLDAWPADKAKAGKEARAKELQRWRDHMIWWNRLYWDNEHHAPANLSAEEWNRRRQEALAAGWEFPAFGSLAGAPADAGNGAYRYRFGLSMGRSSGKPTDAALIANQKLCDQERYYWYPQWTSEGPFYGSVFGSVVSDGRRVYAVNTFGAMAAFDLDGNRQWVIDLAPARQKNSLPCGIKGNLHHQMISPVLADGLVVHHFRDAGVIYGVEAATGKLRWQTEPSRAGYAGHMGPGGTPVVMTLGGATVIVSGNGLVVRVADGRLLGQVSLPAPADAPAKKASADDEGEEDAASAGSSTYNSWTGAGDVLFAQHFRGWVYAIRLGLTGDVLRQELLWRTTDAGDNRDANLIVHDGRLYCGPLRGATKGGGGYSALDIQTGKVLATGRVGGQYNTGLGAADGLLVARTSGWSRENARWTSYGVFDLATLRPKGQGFLAAPKPAGEVAERHIAFLGTPYIAWGVAGITASGNRLFIRSNDYLWCIGEK